MSSPPLPADHRMRGWLEAILENLSEAVTVADGDGNIVLRNRAGRELTLTEVDPDENVASECQVSLRYLDGSRVPGTEYPFARLLRGETVQRMEYAIERRDGSTKIAQFNGTVIREGGKPYLAIVTYMDVTEARRYQDSQQDYLRAVSHDLRNPLAALLAQAQVLEADSRRKGLTEEAKAAQVIINNGRRINAMLEDLIESLRLVAGLHRLRLERADLRSLISDVVERHHETEGRLSLALPDRTAWAVIDTDRVQRCIENLLVNAFQYSPDGSPVTLHLQARDGFADIIVGDKGPGIAPDHLPRIFDRFYRAESSQGRGLGLGLYIVKMTAEAHGGSISVQSEMGVGSTFTLSLPLE